MAINNINSKLDDLYNLHRFDQNEYREVSPAFQWAQNLEYLFIQIKYAHRFDSPGCLEVKNENVDIYKTIVIFTAYCVQGDIPIKFKLNLDLFDEISREDSTFSSSSVGRYQLNLKKKRVGQYWKNMLRDGADVPSNMKMWIEMREKYLTEIQSFIDESEEDEYRKVDEEIELSRKNKKEGKKSDL